MQVPLPSSASFENVTLPEGAWILFAQDPSAAAPGSGRHAASFAHRLHSMVDKRSLMFWFLWLSNQYACRKSAADNLCHCGIKDTIGCNLHSMLHKSAKHRQPGYKYCGLVFRLTLKCRLCVFSACDAILALFALYKLCTSCAIQAVLMIVLCEHRAAENVAAIFSSRSGPQHSR